LARESKATGSGHGLGIISSEAVSSSGMELVGNVKVEGAGIASQFLINDGSSSVKGLYSI
jgi:hypothetical protein